MSPPRIYGHVGNQVGQLVTESKSFAQLSRRMISAAAQAHLARGKKTLFGFGRDQWPDAHSRFEAASQEVLDAMERAGSFEGWGRGPCTYHVLDAILDGDWKHPDGPTAKIYWSWLKSEYFVHWTIKPGKQLLSL